MPSEDERLAALVARCLEAIETEGEAAIDRLCREHSDLAADLREQIETLRTFGMLSPSATRVAPRVPERLGDFRLIERLGSGGMGVVYLAEQISLKRQVALKLVRPEQLYFHGARERFLREVAVIARLEHPSIVPVYTVGEEQGVPYYAMQRIVGCSLADAIAELANRRPETLRSTDLLAAVRRRAGSAVADHAIAGDEPWTETCIRLVAQIAEALDHAHRRGVLHRDLKPSNIMIALDGRARLVDFGLASSGDSSRITRSGSQVGSLPYMAPEQVRGETRAIDARTDVYQLGVTLFELLTLRLPYADDRSEEVRRQILEGMPPPLRTLNRRIPWDVETVCLTAMERDPQRRYASATAFEQDLQNLLAHRTIAARRPGAWLRARRFAQRRPTFTVGAALGALILVGGPSSYAWFQGKAKRELEKEQGITKEERDRADKEGRRAKENFRRLLGAMNELLDPLLDEQGDHLPEMEALRNRMLDRALAVYDGIDPADATDPELRRDLTRARVQSANIDSVMSQDNRAARKYEVSIDDLSDLLAASPDDYQLAFDLGYSLERLGAIMRRNSELKESESHLRRAIATFESIASTAEYGRVARREMVRSRRHLTFNLGEQLRPVESEAEARKLISAASDLVAEDPGDLQSQEELASAHLELGKLLATLVRGERVAEGMQHIDLAVRETRVLSQKDPLSRFAHWRLATALLFRGRAEELNGNLAASGENLAEALQIGEEVRSRFPEVWVYSSDTGFMASTLGALRLKQGRIDEAHAVLRRGSELLRETIRRDPSNAMHRHLLGEALARLGEAERRRGDFAAAIAAYDEAIADGIRTITGTPPAGVARNQRAWPWERIEILIEWGELDAAADSIDELVPEETATAVDRADAAKQFARCALRARKSEDLDEETRERLAAGFEEDAIEQLAQALAKGFKPSLTWLADPALKNLVQREEARVLLSDSDSGSTRSD